MSFFQLKDNIYNGRTNEVKQLLGPFTNKKDIRWIEEKVTMKSSQCGRGGGHTNLLQEIKGTLTKFGVEIEQGEGDIRTIQISEQENRYPPNL